MKHILIIALAVLFTASASATDLKVRKSSKPPVVAASSCMDDLRSKCAGTHKTKTFTKLCVLRNRYRCR